MKWERLAAIRTALLVVFGFGSIAIAAFLVHIAAGFLVLGLCLLVMEYLTQPAERQRQ